MNHEQPLVRTISDTARWVAVYRARETERPGALFSDPFAKRLAGPRGFEIAAALDFGNKSEWSFITRTVLVDRFIAAQVAQGVDQVINLAAGFDARPYRMDLPPSLRWAEIDLPEIIDEKEEILRGEKSRCQVERFRLDLADVPQRQKLFAWLASRSQRTLISCEGLLIYLSAEEVGALASDLHANASFQHWIVDMASPGLLKMLQQKMGKEVTAAGAPYKFGPPEGPPFFRPFGWEPADVQSMLKNAARLKRLSFFLCLLARLPDSSGAQGSRPWGGVVLLERK